MQGNIRSKKIYSQSVKETAQIAKIFLEYAARQHTKKNSALVIGLSGNLGAGKTAFTQLLARHLGIKEKVNSPTFVIMKKYPIPEQACLPAGRARYGARPIKNLPYKFLFHIDAYRLEHEKEILHVGWDEIIGNTEHIVVVEWPEHVRKVMPKGAHTISISIGKDNERVFKLK